MRTRNLLSLVALGLGLGACTKGAPTLDLTVTPTTFALGEAAKATIATTNFELKADDHDEGEDAHAHDVDPHEGHFHLYLDSLETEPLYQSYLPSLDVLITAAQAKPGEHVLIARLHTLDHKILEPQVKDTVTITLTDPATTGAGGAGGSGGVGGAGGSTSSTGGLGGAGGAGGAGGSTSSAGGSGGTGGSG
ncbi:MAG: hypothetical protein FJ096_00625 [Deltaproteobacteria bacterium]|nr:hypothetical protein [Deltaproteobacteria bacterium]